MGLLLCLVPLGLVCMFFSVCTRAGSRQGQEGAWPPQINVVPPQTIIYNISNKRCWSTMPPQDLWLPPHTCLSRPGPGLHLTDLDGWGLKGFQDCLSSIMFHVKWIPLNQTTLLFSFIFSDCKNSTIMCRMVRPCQLCTQCHSSSV